MKDLDFITKQALNTELDVLDAELDEPSETF